MIYKGKCWECETCGSIGSEPWTCPACGKETCENCFHSYMICWDCADGKTPDEVKKISELAGYEWDE